MMSYQFYVDKREAQPVVTNLSSYAHRVVDETVNVRLHLILSTRLTAITLRKVRLAVEESVMGSFLPTLVGARRWYISILQGFTGICGRDGQLWVKRRYS